MDYDERYIIAEEARAEKEEFICECCFRTITGYAAIDPIIIDRIKICDVCASDLVTLRLEKQISKVSLKTKKMKS